MTSKQLSIICATIVAVGVMIVLTAPYFMVHIGERALSSQMNDNETLSAEAGLRTICTASVTYDSDHKHFPDDINNMVNAGLIDSDSLFGWFGSNNVAYQTNTRGDHFVAYLTAGGNELCIDDSGVLRNGYPSEHGLAIVCTGKEIR